MQDLSQGGIVAKYSQRRAGIEVVRAATERFDCPVEFVLLDTSHVVVLAAVGPTASQPRSILRSEREVLAGSRYASVKGRTSALVSLDDARVGALSLHASIDTRVDQQALMDLAADLSIRLATIEAGVQIQEQSAAHILAGLRDTVLLIDRNFRIAWANEAISVLLGYSPDELVDEVAIDLVHPEDIERTLDAATKLVGANRVYRLSIRMRDALGGWVPVSISAIDQTANPNIDGILLTIRNDEFDRETERSLAETRRIDNTIIDSLEDAVVAIDDLGSISVINKAARRLFAIGSHVPISMLKLSAFRLLRTNGRLLDETDHPLSPHSLLTTDELRIASPDGMKHVTVSRTEMSPSLDQLGMLVTFRDITQVRSDTRELRHRALHDELTGLANRTQLSDRLRELKAVASPPDLAVCFVDIDRFKKVNDVHGHNVGDLVLQATAQRLRNQVRDLDIIARPGGDEFLVVLVGPTSEKAAVEAATRMRTSLARPFDVAGIRLHLSASVGVAMHRDGDFDDDSIMRRADVALYAAKERGRDRVEVFNARLAAMVATETNQQQLVTEALDHDRLLMHYQPIVDTWGRTIGAEALARCVADDGTVMKPAHFIEAIKQTKLMTRLDHEAFRQSCALAARLSKAQSTRHMFISTNFSAKTMSQIGFYDTIMHTIQDTGAPTGALCIEVTEAVLHEVGRTGIEVLTELAAAGIRISLDDFGTDQSSLASLRDLPLSNVKLHRSYVAELARYGTEHAIASALGVLARSLGFTVIAEGVESAADQRAVTELGIDKMQGWHFAPALTADELCVFVEGDQVLITVG